MRHILSLSGGKDSTALALLMNDRIPNLEYVFCDTGAELPETLDYLHRLQVSLGQQVTLLRSRHSFEDLLLLKGGYLPSPLVRWCTQYLKLQPFEEHIGNDDAITYIAIRHDERERTGYISTKPNIRAEYPLVDMGYGLDDVLRVLERSGLGLPDYYRWRSRSGCYFCFFQQGIEWVGLLENHPKLFWRAAAFEDIAGFRWRERESLSELARPGRMVSIKKEYKDRLARKRSARLMDVLAEDDEEAQYTQCTICRV